MACFNNLLTAEWKGGKGNKNEKQKLRSAPVYRTSCTVDLREGRRVLQTSAIKSQAKPITPLLCQTHIQRPVFFYIAASHWPSALHFQNDIQALEKAYYTLHISLSEISPITILWRVFKQLKHSFTSLLRLFDGFEILVNELGLSHHVRLHSRFCSTLHFLM